ncbi:3-oxo-5a-steroid 4- dehydrogenase [Ciborinia camelliae]|nr:3-oxo-5a-steroid 4- dehydrogenase [Ciborinia camelliae]
MAVTLKVSNRSPKNPIKRLPTSIDIDETTTVQDVKDQLAKRMGGWDPNRLGIFDPEQKILKDRKAFISQDKEVIIGKEILIKDLGTYLQPATQISYNKLTLASITGPQLGWRTVYIIEYLGPILIHLGFPLLRPYIYSHPTSSIAPLSTSQLLSMALIIIHFIKREYETIFVHRFSLSTMPASNIFKNCLHYWILSGLYVAYFIYAPSSYTALSSPKLNLINMAGVALYIFGEISNFKTHLTLSNLRSPGGTERGIPQGYGFSMVTCPNYFFEILAWIGVVLVTKSWSTVIFVIVGTMQMQTWAAKKEKLYCNDFGDKYKKKRNAIFPTPGAFIKELTG